MRDCDQPHALVHEVTQPFERDLAVLVVRDCDNLGAGPLRRLDERDVVADVVDNRGQDPVAAVETEPPTTENASAPATACAIERVPSAKRGHSKTPIGPFQKIVFARAISAAKRSRVRGPISRPNQPSGSSS